MLKGKRKFKKLIPKECEFDQSHGRDLLPFYQGTFLLKQENNQIQENR